MIEQYIKSMQSVKDKMKDIASANITRAQGRHEENFDKCHLLPSFEVGIKILLKNMARQARRGGKMALKWPDNLLGRFGPFFRPI